MPAETRRTTTNVVVVGKFNPAVFHPSWFGSRGLLPEEEVTRSQDTVQAIATDFMTFQAGWLQFQCLRERCTFTATEAAFHRQLRDLVIGTWRLLPDEPVSAVGLNQDFHVEVETEDAWHAIGDRFVPNEPWSALTNGERAGLLQLQVELGSRQEGKVAGSFSVTNVTLAPSAELPERGIYVAVNDHHQLTTPDEPVVAEAVIPVVEGSWDTARSRAQEVIDLIFAGQ